MTSIGKVRTSTNLGDFPILPRPNRAPLPGSPDLSSPPHKNAKFPIFSKGRTCSRPEKAAYLHIGLNRQSSAEHRMFRLGISRAGGSHG